MYDAVKFTPALARSYFHLVTAQDTKNLKVNLEVSCLKFSIPLLVSCFTFTFTAIIMTSSSLAKCSLNAR